ncbi:TonB C terminal [Desulfacinum hydrothermale DSM 13146]|uniref:TonB C terminal n=1 Tax=Desulfacinum hydrothermale DSM 13146 TaxID=1121390 RepID=A0A1W1X2T7_9BACT|nr:TonB family protein [Desulfacinum hydrothermale]SMC18080.1 TonB C terminal [Desulfacinum hydrothermale DSM 13146]
MVDGSTGFSRLRLPKEDVVLGLGISFVVHVFLAAAVFWLPQVLPRRTYEIPFYTVKLVSPADVGLPSQAPPSRSSSRGKAPAVSKPKTARKGFRPPPVVPVKRLGEVFKPKETEVHKLNAPLSPQVAPVEKPSIEETVEKLLPQEVPRRRTGSASQGSKTETPGPPSSRSEREAPEDEDLGLARRLYYTEVWNAIRSQWALPRSLLQSRKLEAVVVIVVRRDGTIEDIRFEKRSGNALFDDSVLRAIQKANPLPKFPDIYSPPRDEIGIRFRPEDLA